MNKNIMLFIKSIGYRFFGTIATVLISFVLTRNIKISISIGLFEVISKIILYIIYEKIWDKIIMRFYEKNM